MDMEITREKENVYLGRKELEFSIRHEGGSTPAKASIVKELAAKYSAPEENIIINYVLTKKGTMTAVVRAKIYKEKPKIKVVGKKAEGQAAPAKAPAKAH